MSKQLVNTPNEYRQGYDAYCTGCTLEEVHTEEQRRGWWSALWNQADAETSMYLESEMKEMNDEYESYQEDVEWMRRGMS